MKTKYFGAIKATIDEANKRIELTYSKRGKQPLDKAHPARCLSWPIPTTGASQISAKRQMKT